MNSEKPPCPDYQTETELVADLLAQTERDRYNKAYKCLLYACINAIVPRLRKDKPFIRHEINDIVMNALAEFIEKVKVEDKATPLLRRISSNRVIDWIRRRTDKHGEARFVETEPDNVFVNDGGVSSDDSPYANTEFQIRFREFLDTLGAKEKQIMSLLAAGRSDEQVAQETSLSEKRVKNIKTDLNRQYKAFFF